MPRYDFTCDNDQQQHTTEMAFARWQDRDDEIDCPGEVNGAPCGHKATRHDVHRTGFKLDMFFGAKYGFAGPSDRDAWHKDPTVTKFTGPGS